MQLFYQFQCSLVPDRNCWLLNSSLPNLLVIMSCLTESSKKNRWTWFWDISARNLPYLTPVLLVLLFWNDLIVTTFMISFWNLYPHLTYRNCYKYQWMGLVFTGMYPKFIPVTRKWILQVDQHWQLWPSCVTECPANRTVGNRLGNQQSFTCNVETIPCITCKEIYLYQGNLVVIFFLSIFARPDGLRMNLLLHKEFRHGRILSRLWGTGFHCQKANAA